MWRKSSSCASIGLSVTNLAVDSGQASPGGDADSLDAGIAGALQVHPRASWRDLSRLLGTSESTVARRAKALLDSGAIRTTVVIDPIASGMGSPVLLQISCQHGALADVADRLAGRDDVRFVVVVTGRVDIVAEVIARSGDDLAEFLMHDLAEIPGIAATRSESVLRQFKTTFQWSRGIVPGADARRAEVRTAGPIPEAQFDPLERRLIELLHGRGRRSYADLGTELGLSESAVRRRLDALFGGVVARPMAVVQPRMLGFGVEMMFWLELDLGRLEQVAAELGRRPEVRYLAATSGQSDLVVEAIFRTQAELYTFRTSVLGGIDGVRHIEATRLLKTLKRAYLRFDSKPEAA
jgi:DNA-binding Lrp family transcriptional regulator